MTNQKLSKCILCQNRRTLVQSHIIPKFVAKWLKDTSATGYLRQGVSPNVRKQDFPKIELLCHECEGRFSFWEKQFSEKVLIPYHNSGKKEFKYNDWLLRFAVSLAWRIGVIELEGFKEFQPKLVSYLEDALAQWSMFLLDAPSKISEFGFHLLFLDVVGRAEGVKVSEGFHWYLLRGIDATVPASSKEVAVYVKLPGIIFVSGVHPKKPDGWMNTKINFHGLISASNQVVDSTWLGEFLLDRVQQSTKLMDSTSMKQNLKIVDSILKDPKRSLGSSSYFVHLVENYWKRTQKNEKS